MAHRSPTGGNIHILGSKHNLSKLPSPRGVADLSPQNQPSPQYNKIPEREERRVQNEQPPKDPLKMVENAAFLKANSIFLNDMLENLLRTIVVNLQRIQVVDTIRHDSLYKEYTTKQIAPQQVGGYDANKMAQLRKSLDYLLSDSFHDFGKGRNPYFPATIYANQFIDVKLQKLQALIKNIYHGSYQQKDHPDFLKKYLLESKFEESVKVDFLTSELIGDVPDINYFFSENGPINWPVKRQESIADAIVGDIARTKMVSTVKESSVGDWYYIYDACVPSRIHGNIGGKQAFTLAKIWDPSKSIKFSKNELFEATNKNTKLVPEKTQYEGNTIYDWTKEDGQSLYDAIYGDLLHVDTIANKRLIQLRLAVANDEKCYLCIKIANKPFIIDGGFSVNELSAGLYYAELSGDFRQSVQAPNQKIPVNYLPPDIVKPTYRIQKLVEIIDELKNQKLTKEQIISTLLRFKSSGDHGQSKMCQLINNELKEFCIFVSGDNLACVEAISLLNIPVLMRYYSPSNSSKEDDEEEDEEDEPSNVCRIDGTFFVCLYLPVGNNPEKLKAKIEEQVDRIQDLLPYWSVNPNEQRPIIETINILNEKMQRFFDTPFDTSAEKQRDDLLAESLRITSGQLEVLKKMPANIDEGKRLLQLLKSYADNLYLLYYWQTNGFQNVYNEMGVDPKILEPFDEKLEAASENLKRKRITSPIIVTNILQQFEGRTTVNPKDLYSVPELTTLREQLEESFKTNISKLKDVFGLNDENMEKVKNIVRDIKETANRDLLKRIGEIKTKGLGLHLKDILTKSLLQSGPEISFSVPSVKGNTKTVARKMAKIEKAKKMKPKPSQRPSQQTRKRERSAEKSQTQTQKRQKLSEPVVLPKGSNKRKGGPSPGSRNNRRPGSQTRKRQTVR